MIHWLDDAGSLRTTAGGPSPSQRCYAAHATGGALQEPRRALSSSPLLRSETGMQGRRRLERNRQPVKQKPEFAYLIDPIAAGPIGRRIPHHRGSCAEHSKSVTA